MLESSTREYNDDELIKQDSSVAFKKNGWIDYKSLDMIIYGYCWTIKDIREKKDYSHHFIPMSKSCFHGKKNSESRQLIKKMLNLKSFLLLFNCAAHASAAGFTLDCNNIFRGMLNGGRFKNFARKKRKKKDFPNSKRY